jgi:putative flippase GtrA
MSNWRAESALLSRYLGSGMLNTVAGFAVIFALMAVGVSPLWANAAGYAVGLVLGFVVTKKLVFRSNGHFVSESVRYLAAFAVCFGLNVWALQALLGQVSAVMAQLGAAAVYTGSMYVLTRFFVFQDRA